MPDWLILVLVVVGLVGLGAPLYVIIGGFVFSCYALFPVQPDAFGANFFRNFDPTESMASFADQPALAAIPFFMIAGAIMGRGSIAKRLVDVAEAFFGWLPGGLAVSTIFACVFFAAISGSSPVTVVTIGAVMIPALKEAGYTDRMAHGLVTAAGGLGIIIPPSIPMVVFAIYATLSGRPVHVEEIFLAGVIPGIFIAVLLSIYCMITGRHVPRNKLSLRRIGKTLLDGAWSLFLPAFILGGIATGVFDAVEAAAISVVLAIVVELFIHKSLKVYELPAILSEMAVLMGSILLIIAVASGFSDFVEIKELPSAMVAWIRDIDPSPLEFALILNLVLLVVGCFLDIISAIVLFVPLLVPLAYELGFDPLHIGIIFIVNLEIGYLTPPLGLNLFVATTYFKRPFGFIVRSVAPFLVMMLIALAAITYLPSLSLAVRQMGQGESVWVSLPDKVKGADEAGESGEPRADAPTEDEKSMQEMMDDDDVQKLMEQLDESGASGSGAADEGATPDDDIEDDDDDNATTGAGAGAGAPDAGAAEAGAAPERGASPDAGAAEAGAAPERGASPDAAP